MKRYSLIVTIHIVLISMVSVGFFILFEKHFWLSMPAFVLIIISLGVNLYRIQMKQINMMRRFIDSIRFSDMSQTFSSSVKNKKFTALAKELSEALINIQESLFAGEVKRHYYENLLNKVDTAVLVTDINGRIEWMNREAADIFGHISYLPESLLTPSTFEAQVVRLQKSGIIKEMAVSSTSFSTKGKEQLLISLKNIQSVLERNEMEAWQKLISVLTHEIMNSLTPIISVSETISERSPEKTASKDFIIIHQAMQTIHRRSKGLLEFVENYRRLSKIPIPQYSEVSAKKLFDDLRKLFPDDFISFEIPSEAIKLNIDRVQIEQVMINLLKNAKEAVTKQLQPAINVKVVKNSPDDYIKITVEDNGEGIMPEAIDKIFIPFFTTKTTGSGIGLSLCKQIMNLHEGTINVQSLPSKGSCFTITFMK